MVWDKPAIAALPNGNRIKDPYAILRNALPINQKDLREIQNGLEETSDLVRGGRWPAISKATSRSKSLLNNRKKKIIDSIPNTSKKQGEQIIISLKEDLENLNEQATAKKQSKIHRYTTQSPSRDWRP